MLQIDKYAYSNDLTRINPMIKFTFGTTLLLMAIIIENIYINISIIVLLAMMIIFVAKINARRYMGLFLIPSSFLVLSIITILISFSKNNLPFIYSLHIGNIYAGITHESLSFSIKLVLRTLACLSSTYFIALSIPMNQLIVVFKILKVPMVIIEMIILIYRFANIFINEYRDMQTAIELKFGFRGLKNSYHSVSLLVSLLFMKMMKSYEELNTSLEVKNYNGNFYI